MSDALLEVLDAGDIDRLAELLAAGADPNQHFKFLYGINRDITALQVAVAELEAPGANEPGGPIDAVVLLLRHGADPNGWDETRDATPLLMAVMIKHVEAVRILLAAGADPNVRGSEGDSPLRFCAQEGLLEMARLLLHCGADKTIHEAGGPTGMNALGFAATRLNIDMVRLLLSHGADALIEDADLRTTFERLRFASLPEDPASQERLQEIRRLLGAPESTVPIKHRTGQENGSPGSS